jgi:hypothetical protein
MRISPADLIRLRIEAELALDEVRAEVMKAEIAWERRLASGTRKAAPPSNRGSRT